MAWLDLLFVVHRPQTMKASLAGEEVRTRMYCLNKSPAEGNRNG